tara:strand:+ start:1485 stop:1913 length:429 start_codon:yes stop_codon:yes gene_type:complete
MSDKKYIETLKKELENWSKSTKYPYIHHIMLLPDIVKTLSILYKSELVKNDNKTKNKIRHALDYIESGFDLISEELVGPRGYIDDAFISAHILIDIKNQDKELETVISSLIDTEKLQSIINDAEKMLENKIYSMALRIIKTV